MIEMLGLMLLVAIVAIPVGVHLGFRAPRIRERGSPADFGLAFEEVRIPTVRGRILFGWLLPAPDAQGTLVLLHGWGSNAEHFLPLAAPLRRGWLTVLLCDARKRCNRSNASQRCSHRAVQPACTNLCNCSNVSPCDSFK